MFGKKVTRTCTNPLNYLKCEGCVGILQVFFVFANKGFYKC